MKRALVWFKTDLRLHDNEVLCQALSWADEVIPFYCFESYAQTTAIGTQKEGAHRSRFKFESAQDLETNLRERGSGLIVVQGDDVIDELLQVAERYKVQRVYAKKEVAYEERLQLQRAESELLKRGITLELFSTSTLYQAVDLPFSIKEIPDVFTAFRKKVEKDSQIRACCSAPLEIKSPTLFAQDWSCMLTEDSKSDVRSSFPFAGGESAALSRLENYLSEGFILSYKETRDQLHGTDYSTKFSPWLAQGCLSPRTIYHAVKAFEDKHGGNESTYWVIFELLWRDFFRFSFKKHHVKYFDLYGISGYDSESPIDHSTFDQWRTGQTGNDLIDALMHELNQTGFMSNRGRQLVASYLIHELKCDWRYGAAYFEEQLIDYDVCSNWGNWAYIAGVGNDPRGGRQFNIEKQAELYDKKYVFRELWK